MTKTYVIQPQNERGDGVAEEEATQFAVYRLHVPHKTIVEEHVSSFGARGTAENFIKCMRQHEEELGQ